MLVLTYILYAHKANKYSITLYTVVIYTVQTEYTVFVSCKEAVCKKTEKTKKLSTSLYIYFD